ncbi:MULTISPECIES: LytR/AlgR family response regulator transcription factor [Flavobacteriaceae]|uniref:Two-component system LytT family response regulator n=2 Tax=Flavobacteriaceae TaxID=49546 RepID=A0A2T0MB04_9FLAO|nr:response regulator [Allomuricauda pacifica]PRX54669.1 two-component system LytT family response regulator [Allomuricauda pacifica]
MLNTLIVDDESHCIKRLLHLIERKPGIFNVVAACKTVDEAVKVAENNQLDLVFLDIEIDDKTGFDFLRQLDAISFKTIFTTAFDNYAIKAFKFSAFDYLMKPIDFDEFNETILRLNEKFVSKKKNSQVQQLLENIEQKQPKLLTVPSVSGFETVLVAEIVHLEANGNYTYIFTKNKKQIVSKPIKFYENLLDGKQFFKCHKSHLINMEMIKTFHKGKQAYVTMSNDNSVPIAVRRKEAFLGRFK